jgi:hypothetical protein
MDFPKKYSSTIGISNYNFLNGQSKVMYHKFFWNNQNVIGKYRLKKILKKNIEKRYLKKRY